MRCRFCSNLTLESLVNLTEIETAEYHKFPRQAFYQHHQSFDDLESSAHNGCEFCTLILKCFLGTSADTEFELLEWPEQWMGKNCDPDASMYAVAKELDSSSVGIALNSHEPWDQDWVGPHHFDTLLVQVGLKLNLSDRGTYSALPPLPLSLIIPFSSYYNR